MPVYEVEYEGRPYLVDTTTGLRAPVYYRDGVAVGQGDWFDPNPDRNPAETANILSGWTATPYSVSFEVNREGTNYLGETVYMQPDGSWSTERYEEPQAVAVLEPPQPAGPVYTPPVAVEIPTGVDESQEYWLPGEVDHTYQEFSSEADVSDPAGVKQWLDSINEPGETDASVDGPHIEAVYPLNSGDVTAPIDFEYDPAPGAYSEHSPTAQYDPSSELYQQWYPHGTLDAPVGPLPELYEYPNDYWTRVNRGVGQAMDAILPGDNPDTFVGNLPFIDQDPNTGTVTVDAVPGWQEGIVPDINIDLGSITSGIGDALGGLGVIAIMAMFSGNDEEDD